MMLPFLVIVGIARFNDSETTPNSTSESQTINTESSDLPTISTPVAVEVQPSDQILQNAFDNRRSNLQVQGKASVYRILADDLKGSRHQRFLLRTGTGLSLLIAHNIDLAPRIPGIKAGDTVEFYGEYEYNGEGGVVHWTHHDPRGRHVGGWLHHNGRTYQ